MAKTLWCWRCQMELPMLDEDEWAVLMEAHFAAMHPTARNLARGLEVLEREGARRGLPPVRRPSGEVAGIRRLLWHMSAGYELFTGVADEHPNAVWHHRAALYGPPCPACGKPFRTPQSRQCAACGTPGPSCGEE
jgi:hypothetical protein